MQSLETPANQLCQQQLQSAQHENIKLRDESNNMLCKQKVAFSCYTVQAVRNQIYRVMLCGMSEYDQTCSLGHWQFSPSSIAGHAQRLCLIIYKRQKLLSRRERKMARCQKVISGLTLFCRIYYFTCRDWVRDLITSLHDTRLKLLKHSGVLNVDVILEVIYTYKRAVCVCLFVGLLFIGHTRFPTLRRCLRVREQDLGAVEGGPARAGKHAQREHARACRTTSQRKNRSADAWYLSKTKPYARACCRIRNCRDFQKREKENQHATSQVQFTVCLLLECLLFESYWIVFFTNRVCWPPWNHGEPGDLPSLRRRG